MATIYTNKRSLDAFKAELNVKSLDICEYTYGSNSRYAGQKGIFLCTQEGEAVSYVTKTLADDYLTNGRFTMDVVIAESASGDTVLIKKGGAKVLGSI